MSPEWYFKYKQFLDKSILDYLNYYFSEKYNSNLSNFKDAVYYSVKWWKRIRSILALEYYLHNSSCDIESLSLEDDIIKFCISLELMHAYSLVHDDLPAMDNDIYRRWDLTVWKKFWEDNWVLVWDLLNSLSFELLWSINNKVIWLELVRLFGRSVWFYWMIWWQVLDIFYEWKWLNDYDLNSLIETHNFKTGALIWISIIWWLMLSWKDFDRKLYSDLWIKLWLWFQVRDDILEKYKWKEYIEEKWFVYFLWEKKSLEYLDNLKNYILSKCSVLESEKILYLVDYICSIKNK